jgi:hypothetical protein
MYNHRTRTRNGHKHSWFTVTFKNHRFEYSYGGRSGITKDNAYMEAARCLRHLLVHQIQLLDISMGYDVELSDFFDFVDQDIIDETSTRTPDNPLDNNTILQPIINITNSNVTISNTPNRHIVYDDDDNLEFIFESLRGHLGPHLQLGITLMGLILGISLKLVMLVCYVMFLRLNSFQFGNHFSSLP